MKRTKDTKSTKDFMGIMEREDGVRMRHTELSEEIEGYSNAVIGAAIEVHRMLGPGFAESVYEEALCIELSLRQIPFSRQHVIKIGYKGRTVGEAGWICLLAMN